MAIHSEDHLLECTTQIICAALSGGNAAEAQLALIPRIYAALAACRQDVEVEATVDVTPRDRPISIKKSIMPDKIISMEDGKPYAILKRHLTKLGMTPAQYRARWGLPDDYPMVAPNYAARRAEIAREVGLGRKRT